MSVENTGYSIKESGFNSGYVSTVVTHPEKIGGSVLVGNQRFSNNAENGISIEGSILHVDKKRKATNLGADFCGSVNFDTRGAVCNISLLVDNLSFTRNGQDIWEGLTSSVDFRPVKDEISKIAKSELDWSYPDVLGRQVEQIIFDNHQRFINYDIVDPYSYDEFEKSLSKRTDIIEKALDFLTGFNRSIAQARSNMLGPLFKFVHKFGDERTKDYLNECYTANGPYSYSLRAMGKEIDKDGVFPYCLLSVVSNADIRNFTESTWNGRTRKQFYIYKSSNDIFEEWQQKYIEDIGDGTHMSEIRQRETHKKAGNIYAVLGSNTGIEGSVTDGCTMRFCNSVSMEGLSIETVEATDGIEGSRSYGRIPKSRDEFQEMKQIAKEKGTSQLFASIYEDGQIPSTGDDVVFKRTVMQRV